MVGRGLRFSRNDRMVKIIIKLFITLYGTNNKNKAKKPKLAQWK